MLMHFDQRDLNAFANFLKWGFTILQIDKRRRMLRNNEASKLLGNPIMAKSFAYTMS